MGVCHAVGILDQGCTLGGFDDRKVREFAQHIVQKGFHACSIDDKGIGVFERLQVGGAQLIVVQAAGLGTGHARNGHTGDISGNIAGKNMHGVKRSDNPEFIDG